MTLFVLFSPKCCETRENATKKQIDLFCPPPHLSPLAGVDILSTWVAITAAIYRSAQGPGTEKAPESAFRVISSMLQRVLRGVRFGVLQLQKCQRARLGALFGALWGRRTKSLEKHSSGHFPARARGHSCRWQPGSQHLGASTD